MLNNLFKKYSDESFEEIEIDSHHKNQLQNHLFKPEKVKKPFWNWTKAIFTAPVVAAFGIIFLLSSNQETVKQVLLPQEALAQALENAFNLDSFEKTFGLPDDKKFHHRKIIHISTSYDDQQNQGQSQSLTSTINLWSDGLNLRKDDHYNDGQSETEDVIFSNLLNKDQNFSCNFDSYQGASCEEFNQVQQIELAQQKKEFFIAEHGGIFFPVQEENMIAHISFESFYFSSGPGIYLSFSTAFPIKDFQIGFVDSNYSALTIFIEQSEFDGSEGKEYLNKKQGEKYWHRIEVEGSILNIDDHFYFQAQDVTPQKFDTNDNFEPEALNQSSMIYSLNPNKELLSPLTSKAFFDQLPENLEYIQTIGSNLRLMFEPAFYVMRYPEQFEQPLDVSHTEYHGQKVTKLSYILPDTYSIETYNGLDPTQDQLEKPNYSVNFFMDEYQNYFLGYSILRNEKEIQSLWIEDEILPPSEKENIFRKNEWEIIYKNTPIIMPDQSAPKKE